ncbi:MAG: penicillin-binding protein [Lachnospiraceae bacterium]|nr:penicillin-binding protein [Lachnospiraceae bacterium]
MLELIKKRIINFITSRSTFLMVIVFGLCIVLINRCFQLQIVHGAEYLEEFMLMTQKTRDISSVRGNIYDRNGNLLAYNELAYSVKMEDVLESGSTKNQQMNETVLRLIRMVEKNGDHVITDFKIVIGEDGNFEYTVSGNSLLRFLADVYGKSYIDQLDAEQRASTPLDVMNFLSRKEKGGFAIGEYEIPGDKKSKFIPGKGYDKSDWLKIINIRYAMSLTSFRKYLGTTVATNVSQKTVAAIMENAEDLPGVTIEEDTIRRYVDSVYFAHVLGYTGKVSSDELTQLNEKLATEGNEEKQYGINDVVGKSGIESYMELTLQGNKGYETVVVDHMGKVIAITDRKDATSGKDVYLSIDKDLTEAVYEILEQHLAGLIASKIVNKKEYIAKENASSSDIVIPIYDVYFALINNNVIDTNHFTKPKAGETEKAVYQAYLEYKDKVYERIRQELFEKKTVYSKLSKEYQVYESNIVNLLTKNGIINSDLVDQNDKTVIAWTKDETISLSEYLTYLINRNWIDAGKLKLTGEYSDSTEVFEKLANYLVTAMDENAEFQKRFYKYMLLNDKISGKQICMILCEQRKIDVPLKDEDALYKNKLSAYQFMMNRIKNIDVTPAQLALDPCNGSVVITDVNSGQVLALVSYPGYDNNKLANSIDADYYAKLNADKSYPWNNYATQYKAAPGSTFKMVTASAGLMEGAINLNTKINCSGTYTNITPSPRCWQRWGHGNETVVTAIRDSCNYYFYDVGYRLSLQNGTFNEEKGLNTLYQYADFFGLSDKSGIEITESSPQVSDNDPVRSAIGQASNSFTSVGLARYVSAVANGGTVYNLTLLDHVSDQQGNLITKFEPKIRNTIDMEKKYWDSLHKGMRMVVQNKSYFNDLAVEVAGKTGTAQQTDTRPSHALFVCYAPYDKPEIAIATRIPFGYSSDYAAQVSRDVIMYYYGLAEEEDLVTGTANTPDAGITNEW